MHSLVIFSCFALCLSIGFIKTDDFIPIDSVDDNDPQELKTGVLTIDGSLAADPASEPVLNVETDISQGQDSPAAVQDDETKDKDQYDDITLDPSMKDPQDEPAVDSPSADKGDDNMVKKTKKCDDDKDSEECEKRKNDDITDVE
jgi:hypothetical protein